eukprot:TRINITY_DN8152_c0_g1_i3.p1 TRINITY_DN8152_c0_g1~~TRINITY_DN8152_c0_g1_i3.p1  ORF type:complete len:244 (+),score=32.58 TRINITY_DN8152_c0_g1_i3:117-848(+)
MISGSMALPDPVMLAWEQTTGHKLLERYGMTEIGMALTNTLDDRRPGFVGIPFPGVSTRLAPLPQDSASDSGCVEAGEIVGELEVKGDMVFAEYWNKPEATKSAFTADGWFKTGDIAAQRLSDGWYRILGRASVDIIKSGGFKISALDVERVLMSHPNISEVAVVGVDDTTWGSRVGAVVVWQKPSEALNLQTLRKWCADKLPPYSAPSVLFAAPKGIPRNAMGKINKKTLCLDPNISILEKH